MSRYKLVVQVVLGEIKGQGLKIASKCLWDPNFDNWASYTFTNVIIVIEAELTGVYLWIRIQCMLAAWFSEPITNKEDLKSGNVKIQAEALLGRIGGENVIYEQKL